MNKKLRIRPAHTAAAWSALVLIGAACSQSTKVELPPGRAVEGFDAVSARIQKDPVAFMRESLNETKKVAQFTTQFQRQERLGLLKELHPAENIFAEYRDDPFSVRFTWLDADSEYIQCVFVQGKNNDKVLILSRKSPLGLPGPPGVAAFPTDFAVLFGKARNPITDFGPRRMMERTIDRIEKGQAMGDVKMAFMGASEIGPAKEPCFHIELRYPAKDPFPCKLQDLYIHTTTHLPVATYLWLPGKIERTNATLDALYQYAQLDPKAQLAEANFVIDKNNKSETGKTTQASLANQGPAREPDSK